MVTTPQVRKTKRSTPLGKRKQKRKPKMTIQDVYARYGRNAFGPSATCVVKGTASVSKRLKKTPSENAKHCVHKVRLGQDGSHLYFAQKTWKKNPKIPYSTTPTGQGMHLAFKWMKLYNKRTQKPYNVSKAPDKYKYLS